MLRAQDRWFFLATNAEGTGQLSKFSSLRGVFSVDAQHREAVLETIFEHHSVDLWQKELWPFGIWV